MEQLRAAVPELARLNIPERTVEAFVDGWARAVTGEDEELTSLVWAVRFQDELERRKRDRLAEVRGRRDRMTRGEDEAAMIRDAMDAEGISSADRIVEVSSS